MDRQTILPALRAGLRPRAHKHKDAALFFGSAGGLRPRGCTGFDGIVGGLVSEPWPRATLKAGN